MNVTTDYDEADELRAQDNANRAWQRRINANPDCRDPDHPGCDQCMGDDNEGESGEDNDHT